MERKNINRGFKNLRVWEYAVSFTYWPVEPKEEVWEDKLNSK